MEIKTDITLSLEENLALSDPSTRVFYDFMIETGLLNPVGGIVDDPNSEVLSLFIGNANTWYRETGVTARFSFAPLDSIHFYDFDKDALKSGTSTRRQLRSVFSLISVDMDRGTIDLHNSIFASKPFVNNPPMNSMHSSKTIRVLKRWLTYRQSTLDKEGIEPSFAKIIQLWAYEIKLAQLPSKIGPEARALVNKRAVDLVKNDIAPTLGMQSLSYRANPRLKEGIFDYSLGSLKEFADLPSAYTRHLLMGE